MRTLYMAKKFPGLPQGHCQGWGKAEAGGQWPREGGWGRGERSRLPG